MKRSIVITKDGKVSVFSNFKKMCDAHGWKDEYNSLRSKGFPFFYDGYKIERIPEGVTISNFKMVSTVCNYGPKSYGSDGHLINQITFSEYSTDYVIDLICKIQHEPAEEITTDRGLEVVKRAYDDQKLVDVVKVTRMDDKGEKELFLDPWTKEQLMDAIIID